MTQWHTQRKCQWQNRLRLHPRDVVRVLSNHNSTAVDLWERVRLSATLCSMTRPMVPVLGALLAAGCNGSANSPPMVSIYGDAASTAAPLVPPPHALACKSNSTARK